MFIATIVLSALLAFAFFGAGASKLSNAVQSVTQRDQLTVPPSRWRTIGALEILGAAGVAIGLAFAPLGIVAAASLGLLMIGAIVAHIRANDAAHVAPAIVLMLLAVATVIVRAISA